MDLSFRTAAARLKAGDTAFILAAPPARMGELARLHPSAPFYAGLLVKGAGDEIRAAALFEAALGSASPRVRGEAARELIVPLLKKTIPPERVLPVLLGGNPASRGIFETAACGAALYSLGRYGEIKGLYEKDGPRNSWDRAFLALASLSLSGGEGGGEEFRAFFFNGPPDDAFRWALEEGGEMVFSPAAAGRLAAARSAFREALRYFRTALEEDRDLFFQYPDLAGDLGRAFQFAGAGEEGIRLFLEWEGELEPAGDQNFLRYRLLYYAGRMARQLDRHTQGAELFIRALALAPDGIQEDACIWYILSAALASGPENAADQVKAYIPRWNQDTYFEDLLDQLSRYLTAKRRWKTLGEIFSLILPRSDGASAAKYAWILGRAVEEGYLPPAEGAAFLGEEGKGWGPAEIAGAFFRIAFEKGDASFYYRALGASRLGDAVLIAGEEPKKKTSGGGTVSPSDDLRFLLGFFEFGAGAHVSNYLDRLKEGLPVFELRAVAEAFAGEERWADSIRLTGSYMARRDYVLNRRDLELGYPRPFREIIEENAAALDLSPALLYGLIRTESAFTPAIVSRAGAVGLSQLMEPTAKDMAGRIARQGGPDYLAGDKLDLADPAINLHIGAFYLDYLLDRMESPLMALLAYNGGMGRLRRWRAAEPALPEDLFLETVEFPETREYGRRVLAAAAAYGYLYYGMSMEALIADIFKEE